MTDELTSPTPRRRARKVPVDPWADTADTADTAQAEPAATATGPTPDTSQAAEAGDGFGDMAELAGSLELDAEPAEAEEEGGEVVPFERREGGTTWAGVTPELRAERDEVEEDDGDEEAAAPPPKKAKKPAVTDYPARPYSSRERLCSTTLEIAVELTVEEVNDRARKLAGITKEEDTLREEKSAFLSTWNGKMKELQTERRELSEAVSLGKERQDFAVHIEADYDRGIAEYVCQSTGRVLETRQLTSDEAAAGRQRRLPLH